MGTNGMSEQGKKSRRVSISLSREFHKVLAANKPSWMSFEQHLQNLLAPVGGEIDMPIGPRSAKLWKLSLGESRTIKIGDKYESLLSLNRHVNYCKKRYQVELIVDTEWSKKGSYLDAIVTRIG